MKQVRVMLHGHKLAPRSTVWRWLGCKNPVLDSYGVKFFRYDDHSIKVFTSMDCEKSES